MQNPDPDFEWLMMNYLSKKGPEKPKLAYLDESYPGLSHDSMYTDDGLDTGLQIFLTLVHVLEPQKAKTVNEFLANELPQIRYDSDFRQKAYKFLKGIIE